MNKPSPLTQEEREFAEANMGLVYSFLRRKHLNPGDYYDVVIFGYLNAVKSYCRTAPEERKAQFSAFAYFCMEREIIKDWNYRNRKKRSAVLVSMDALRHVDSVLCSTEDFLSSFHDVLPDKHKNPESAVLDAALIECTLDAATPRQRKAIGLSFMGYQTSEIAQILGVTKRNASHTLYQFRLMARSILKESAGEK